MLGTLRELGYVDPTAGEIDRRWFRSLTGPVLALFEALSFWRRAVGVKASAAEAARSIARLALTHR